MPRRSVGRIYHTERSNTNGNCGVDVNKLVYGATIALFAAMGYLLLEDVRQDNECEHRQTLVAGLSGMEDHAAEMVLEYPQCFGASTERWAEEYLSANR
jgi:hypothetical protein